VAVPEWKRKEAEDMAAKAGPSMYQKYAVVDGAGYVNQDNLVEMYLGN
jgi:hypothetical protein